ncbi:TPA_asm: hypothetical protein G0G78_27190 [Salmonella enterica]|nr:hypothetical protein [Salmonella enterica]EAO7619060.1 hypothetical protein [Salmonella enterica]EAQ6819690.1 hypothetical protein [Salmonella enterica]HAC8240054.1 hypothetical protein [Salmonella enterica]HAC8273580.1 hypothetical protein [Salmonella enterica]
MNRLFYRLIFNVARQMVMVVSDITRSHRAGPAGSGENRTEKTTNSRIHWSVRPAVTSLWLTLGMVTFSVSASDIKADGNTENADINGARNILAAGHAVLACGGMAQSGRPLKQEPTETTQTPV